MVRTLEAYEYRLVHYKITRVWSEAQGIRDRGRSCKKLLDEVNKAYTARSLELSDAKVMRVDGEQWRDL